MMGCLKDYCLLGGMLFFQNQQQTGTCDLSLFEKEAVALPLTATLRMLQELEEAFVADD